MRKALALAVVLGCCALFPYRRAIAQARGCVTLEEYAPIVVANPDAKVTFRCDHATPLDLIYAIGRQTRTPIGIVLGRDPNILSRTAQRYDLENEDARSALRIAIQGTAYSLKEENDVLVLMAGDLSSRQSDLLTHRYSDFKTNPNSSMVMLGAHLTMWLRAATEPMSGYASSILGSTNDERFTLERIPSATTEEIANRIVTLGSKGMWFFRVRGTGDGGMTDEVEIQPYQHYSNRANIEPR